MNGISLIMKDVTDTQKEFAYQAKYFGGKELTLAKLENVHWAFSLIREDLAGGDVLDVACGTGLVSLAMADFANSVTGLDATQEMLDVAKESASIAGIHNLRLLQGNADSLPFESSTFDIVFSRFSIHHFESPERVIKEMLRVSKTGSKLLIVDLVAPEGANRASAYNKMETMRDPTHRQAFTECEFEELFERCSLNCIGRGRRTVKVAVEPWLEMTSISADEKQGVRDLIKEMATNPDTAFMFSIEEGRSSFSQEWVAFLVQGKS